MLMFLVSWLAFAACVALFANVRRNRNAFAWFLLALAISPLLAAIILAILLPVPPAAPYRGFTPHGAPLVPPAPYVPAAEFSKERADRLAREEFAAHNPLPIPHPALRWD